jgi:hypothetical protein
MVGDFFYSPAQLFCLSAVDEVVVGAVFADDASFPVCRVG